MKEVNDSLHQNFSLKEFEKFLNDREREGYILEERMKEANGSLHHLEPRLFI